MRCRSPLAILVVMATALSVLAQGKEPDAAAGITTVRIVTGDSSLAWLNDVARQYNSAHPNVRVDVRGGATHILSCAELVAGRADLIAIYGDDNVYQYQYEAQRGKLLPMSGAFKRGELTTHLLGRRAMAVVVSPANGLNEVSAAQMLQLTRYATGQDVADPLADRKLSYVTDGIFDGAMRTRILGPRTIARRLLPEITGSATAWYRPGEMLDSVATDAKLMAFMRIGDHIWGSGVKVLPVRLADGRLVLPTTEHVMSGAYPYHCSLMLVVPAKASQVAKDVAATALAPDLLKLLSPYWITPETPQPGTPKQTIWPAPPSAADQKHTASVAVLPVEQLSAYFRLADGAVQARYEDDISAGISQAGGVTPVDREQLRRVLSERATKLLAAGDAGKSQPIIAADVIVLGRVISRDTVAYLRIEAFHSGTASCIGLLELPINSASPASFDPPLKDLAAKWWPGVMAHLARARKGPIWTLTEDAATAGDAALAKTRTALEETLAAAEGVFFARYSHVPAAQREVLLRLMGLSRSEGQLAVAADYVVALGKSGDGAKLTIRQGNGEKQIAEKAFADAGCAAWLGDQIAALSGRAASSDAPAETQARREYEQGLAVKKQWDKLQVDAYARYRAANRNDYLPEDKARLDELTRQMDRHFERAMQLNPAAEAVALENIYVLMRKGFDYLSLRDSAQACLEFVDRYPRSGKLGLAIQGACTGLSHMAARLENPDYRAGKVVGFPPGLDNEKLSRRYRRQHLALLASAVRRAGNKHEDGYGGMKSRREFAQDYQSLMDKYAAIASPRELDDALDEYARACDAHAAQAVHSDFLRLRYMARRGEKRQYLDLLADMQRRWADPNGNRWKLAGEQTSQEMCELFRMDPRRNSLYLWLKGRRGPGDLPYAGYQAASQPASGPAAAVPAGQATKDAP